MTTDWWSVQAPGTTGARQPELAPGPGPGPGPELGPGPGPIPEPDLYDDPEPARPPAPPLPPSGDREPDGGPDAGSHARSKAKKVMGAVAVVIVAGILTVNAVSGDDKGDEGKQAAASAPAEQGGALPAAGAGPTDLPAAGNGPAWKKPSVAPQGKVTLIVKSSGKADQIGSFVELTVRNDTRKPVTLLGSLFRGDGHQALIGEGTLISGSRVIQPGETAQGTVEFLSSAVPQQVALLDEAGGVVAVADKG
ncbi:hypothetical protein ACWCOW_39425 [Streptomyces sp. NPDC001939]